MPHTIINNLSINMIQTTKDIQTWTFRRALYMFADMDMTPLAGCITINFWFHVLSTFSTFTLSSTQTL